MSGRKPTNPGITARRTANDLKVLKHIMKNLDTLATGRTESPQKLMVFYAAYTAMRSLWEVKTNHGQQPSGDSALDGKGHAEPGHLVFRVNMEVAHSIGKETKTLLRVTILKYWGERILRLWG
jgi:hypothetical protein